MNAERQIFELENRVHELEARLNACHEIQAKALTDLLVLYESWNNWRGKKK